MVSAVLAQLHKEPESDDDEEEKVFSTILKEIDDLENNEDDFDAEAQEKDKLLDMNYKCACSSDGKIDIIFELKPTPPIYDSFGVPIPTPQRVQRAPVRIMLVLDISHSMVEPFNDEEGEMSRLDRLKLFAELYVRQMPEEHKLGIVTFGTEAHLNCPLRRMTHHNKDDTVEAIHKIASAGVTNISAGLYLAQSQFIHPQKGLKNIGPAFNDFIILFTDGLPNEGIRDSHQLISEFYSRTLHLAEEYHYPPGYDIRITTIGTWGFFGQTLFELGQAFSTDAFCFLDDTQNMEINIFRSVFMRDATFAHRIRGSIMALNGVTMEMEEAALEKHAPIMSVNMADTDKDLTFFMYDICESSERHIPITIQLPPKHAKRLKNQDILQIQMEFMDRAFRTRSAMISIAYKDIPKKPKYNLDQEVAYVTKHKNRIAAGKILNDSCNAIAVLSRDGAKCALEYGIGQIQTDTELTCQSMTDEKCVEELREYTQPLVDNLEFALGQLENLELSWDDGWGRMKAMASSLIRESPAPFGIYAPGVELFEIRDINRRMKGLVKQLHEHYRSRGHNTQLIETFMEFSRTKEDEWNQIEMMDDEDSIICFNLKIN